MSSERKDLPAESTAGSRKWVRPAVVLAVAVVCVMAAWWFFPRGASPARSIELPRQEQPIWPPEPERVERLVELVRRLQLKHEQRPFEKLKRLIEERENPPLPKVKATGGRGRPAKGTTASAARKFPYQRKGYLHPFLRGVSVEGRLMRGGPLHGNSRRWGDISEQNLRAVLDAFFTWAKEQKLSPREGSHRLAVDLMQSGGNPDAADPDSDAVGLSQVREVYLWPLCRGADRSLEVFDLAVTFRYMSLNWPRMKANVTAATGLDERNEEFWAYAYVNHRLWLSPEDFEEEIPFQPGEAEEKLGWRAGQIAKHRKNYLDTVAPFEAEVFQILFGR